MMWCLKNLFLASLSILALSSQTFAAAVAAAHVLSVNPGVVSIFQDKIKTVAAKMDIPIKASVRSDATGNAQMIFPDDFTLSIVPGPELMLAELVDTPLDNLLMTGCAITWHISENVGVEIGWLYLKSHFNSPFCHYDQHQINTGLVFSL